MVETQLAICGTELMISLFQIETTRLLSFRIMFPTPQLVSLSRLKGIIFQRSHFIFESQRFLILDFVLVPVSFSLFTLMGVQWGGLNFHVT